MPETGTDKLDLYKVHKAEYATPKEPVLVETQPAKYLAVPGQGTPGGAVFQQRIAALYGMAYALKFASKAAGRDYVVCKLEGLWGFDGQPAPDFAALPPDEWKWKMVIRLPDFTKDKDLAAARAVLAGKGKDKDCEHVQLEKLDEGLCVQMLHVGPYEEADRTIEAMHAFAAEQGLTRHLLHHEIYLSDPRRVAAEKLRTILRQPVTSP